MSTTTIHRIQSESSPSRSYTVEEKNGRLSCECPSFRFDRHRSKSCKHVELLRSEPDSTLITRDVKPDTEPSKPWMVARRAAPTRRDDWTNIGPAREGVITTVEQVEELLRNALSLRHQLVLAFGSEVVGQSERVPDLTPGECVVLLHRVEVAEFIRSHDDLTAAARELLNRAKAVA